MKIPVFFLLSITLVHFSIAQVSNSAHPIVVISTGASDLDTREFQQGTMGIINDTVGGSNSTGDSFTDYNGMIGLKYRGNSSRGFDKKPYALQLWSSPKQPVAKQLLGMPADADWILHAMHIDKSLLRVPITFYFSEKMGHYACRWCYVELIVNGKYQGLYTLVEKIKRAEKRVNIDALGETDGTGGFILKLDWDDGGGGFNSEYDSQGGLRTRIQYVEPKGTSMAQAQKDYLKNWFVDFEDALFSENFKNKKGKHYTEYLDMEAFVDFFLINEFSKNSDGYKLSTYFYKDTDQKDGRLKAGPIWDFDQTYGMSLVCSNNDPCGWTYLQNQDGCEDLNTMPLWWQALTKDTTFCNLAVERWKNFRNSFLQQDSIYNWIDSMAVFIEDGRMRNFERWPIIGTDIWIEPEPIPETYESEIELMKSWIAERLEWMDRNMNSLKIKATAKNNVKVYPNPVRNVAYVATITGSSLTVCDALGRQILQASNCTEGYYQLNIAGWHPGVYIVYVTSTQGTSSGRFVVY